MNSVYPGAVDTEMLTEAYSQEQEPDLPSVQPVQ